MAYIDKKRALNILRARQCLHQEDGDGGCADSLWDMCLAIEDLPEADVVEVKHGYFVRNERNIPKMKEFHEKGCALSMSEKSIFYTCSECGVWISLSQKYCSMCGAKMDGTPKERGGQFVD